MERLRLQIKYFLLFLFLALPAHAQLYPMPNGQPPMMQPFQNNAYGPGINSDATGRPFTWQPQGSMSLGQPDPTIQPNINAYGLGQSSDQFGRPIQPQTGLSLWEQQKSNALQPFPGQGLSDFGQ